MILLNLPMVEKIGRIIFFWLPAVLWMGLIYFLSSFHKLQASPVGWQDFFIRKTAHFLEFTVLYLLFNRGFKNTSRITVAKRLILVFFLTIFYAASDEYHQTFISGRTGKPFDIWIDSLGALFGLVFSLKLINFLPKKVQKII